LTTSCGLDIGSTTSKCLLLLEGGRSVSAVRASSRNPSACAAELFDEVLGLAGIGASGVARVVATGYGREMVAFAQDRVSELSCHGRGAHHLLPSVRTVIDVGGQDSKAILVDARGALLEYVMNDKCAAGTGRFLENMARTLELEVDQLAAWHRGPGEPAMIGSMCAIFAESEVIGLMAKEVALASIVKGIHLGMATRVAALARRNGLEPQVAVTGGVAKNDGFVEALASKLGAPVRRLDDRLDPQLVGALGAAVIAAERARG
jgi:predicted CoA-substrate-specific enzyme activase